ncbi:MAG: hypothetical protein LBJ61_03300 [Deltaproteobacteria bacterium]|jgi:cell division protein FtsZ|nr:hypothetical protein [Deltaproteobacteria bacterium]
MADETKSTAFMPGALPLCRIIVLGLGGCGTNAVNHMVNQGLEGPAMIASNTDVAHLMKSLAPTKIQLGPELTEGLGAGSKPSVGRDAALESMPEIIKAVGDAHLVFVTAGLGGGTGTGAAPVVVENLMKLKKPPLVVSVVVLPFKHELDRPAKAKPAYDSLLATSNSLISVSNERLLETWPEHSLKECKAMANHVLYRAVSCITDLILHPGEIHLDFADIKTALSAKGLAIMGVGEAGGQDRGIAAAEMAINCPLMDDKSIKGAKFLLINITAPEDIKGKEFKAINEFLVNQAGPGVQVLSGVTYDDELAETGFVKVTVIATGLSPEEPIRESLDDDDDDPITLLVETEPQITLAPEPPQPSSPQARIVSQPQSQQYQGQPTQGQYQPQPQAQMAQGQQYQGQYQQTGQPPQQPQPVYGGDVQTPGSTPEPPPRRKVRLYSAPVDRVPSMAAGYNKYESNSMVDPKNLMPRTSYQRPQTPPQQRTLPPQSPRGVSDAKQKPENSYMVDKAN